MDGRDGLPGLQSAENSGYVAVPGPPGDLFLLLLEVLLLISNRYLIFSRTI